MQFRQVAIPEEAAYFPCSQSVQLMEPSNADLPVSQSVHVVAPVSAVAFPAGQALQEGEFTSPVYLPASQTPQTSPSKEAFPCGQALQVEDLSGDDFPAGHLIQLVAPMDSTYLPGGQL